MGDCKQQEEFHSCLIYIHMKLNQVTKVLFIKTYCTVDWNNVSKSLVHQDSWHCGLEKCNDKAALFTERCKDCWGRVGLFFSLGCI
jgi:hypothetical protein